MIAALLAMILGIGMALYCFHDAGAISDESFLAVMVLVVAVPAGILIAMDIKRQAHRDAQPRFKEVPPPFDVYMVWPPECGWMAGEPQEKDDTQPAKPRRAKRGMGATNREGARRE